MRKRGPLNSKSEGERMSQKPKKEEEEEEEDSTPLRSICCVKYVMDIKRFDEMEDCYLLDFDPFHSLNLTFSFPKDDHSDSDVSLVAEKGKVACRDYPHARYLCLKYPFHTTPHETHCDLCYCYVCDSVAPCANWTPHCHASHKDRFWKKERRSNRDNHHHHHHTPPPLLH